MATIGEARQGDFFAAGPAGAGRSGDRQRVVMHDETTAPGGLQLARRCLSR
ncbi:hypothetical protein [Roseiarcus fermentans]|uniref:hypothetical protein n=1 Tax=Roseiarcus fermentans TaxID=1473586 RepID=UPI001472AB2F|nr:hypothetical protein [Roseiarcus fermentans]